MSTLATKEFIEASAGTGKTFNIVETVVGLVVSGVKLDSILIVTYTEKATGELRRRIRSGLESHWRKMEQDSSSHEAEPVRRALDTMDDAAIYTIHGFCQRMLREYAFETRQPFQQQLIEDPLIWNRLFARSLRGTWRRNILDRKNDPLRCASAYQNGFYRKEIIDVASRFIAGDVLQPESSPSLPIIRRALEDVTAELQPVLGSSVDNSPLVQRSQSSSLNGNSKNAFKKRCTELIDLLAVLGDSDATALQIQVILDWNPQDAFWKHLDKLKEANLLDESQVEAFKRLKSLKSQLKASLLSCAVEDMCRSLSRFKRTGGYIDYNDMLLLLRDALGQSERMVQILQNRFSCALVDEFQDTDQVQWDIFRKAFLGSNAHRLTVVGDPKQAIYSFRGANLQAYLAAKDRFENGVIRSLDTNYRSDPALLEALNCLFGRGGGWFSDDPTGIQYKPVQAPTGNTLRARVFADDSGRAPLTLVRPPEDATGRDCREAFAAFAAGEIKHLLGSNIKIAEWEGKEVHSRALNAGDICLLIRTRTELPVLRRALQKANLPYSFARGTGLFASTEALEWRYLLRTIAAPGEPRAVMKALLTRFFDVPSSDIESYSSLSEQHPLRAMINGWHQHSQRREWHQLMRKVIEESGVLLRAMNTAEGDRIVTNYQHLAQLLLEHATRSGGTLTDLIAFLDAQCSRVGEEDEQLQRLETEEPRVQIMTMHAAKGLEFPVVFVAGGFTYRDISRGYSSYTTSKGRVYSFSQDDESKNRQNEEQSDELRRLFYVALTRAQYKLYLPALPEISHSPGPLATFVRTALETAGQQAGWVETGQVTELSIGGDGLITECSAAGSSTVHDSTNVQPWTDQRVSEIDKERLQPPQVSKTWGWRRTRVTSYSSLAQQHAKDTAATEPTYTVGEEATAVTTPRMDDEGEAPVSAGDMGATAEPTALPSGAATGSLLHEVLEKINYHTVLNSVSPAVLLGDDTTRQLLESKLRQHLPRREAHFEDDLQQVARTTWLALQTPLPFISGKRIAEMSQLRHEIEFLLPAQGIAYSLVPGVRLQNTFLTGFIDLVFCYEERYYILDWKSNTQAAGDYSRPELEQMMTASQYDLQYKIYVLALDRMLRLAQKDYEPDKHLGGVCYLFLRGLEGEGEEGIYHVPHNLLNVNEIERDVYSRLRTGSTGATHV